MNPGEIILLTGGISTGKTNLCLDIAKKGKEQGMDVAGIISPGVFSGPDKIAIDALDLRTWTKKRLADLRKNRKTDLETERWAFDPSTTNWGNQVLAEALPCELFIIDELGPLEFERREGWLQGFSALESGAFRVAVVVIRPSLVNAAEDLWKISYQIDLDLPDQEISSAEDFFSVID